MREQLLDFFDVRQAILSPLEVLGWPSYGEESGAFMQALNEWMIEEWLEQDPRLYGAISISVEDGTRAAQQIARAAPALSGSASTVRSLSIAPSGKVARPKLPEIRSARSSLVRNVSNALLGSDESPTTSAGAFWWALLPIIPEPVT